jgi:hypothetical protein
MGAVQMARLCADLEDQAGTTDLTGAPETLRRLDDAFDWVRARLRVLAGSDDVERGGTRMRFLALVVVLVSCVV